MTTLITGFPGLVALALVERLLRRRPDERFACLVGEMRRSCPNMVPRDFLADAMSHLSGLDDFVRRHPEIDSVQEHR